MLTRSDCSYSNLRVFLMKIREFLSRSTPGVHDFDTSSLKKRHCSSMNRYSAEVRTSSTLSAPQLFESKTPYVYYERSPQFQYKVLRVLKWISERVMTAVHISHCKLTPNLIFQSWRFFCSFSFNRESGTLKYGWESIYAVFTDSIAKSGFFHLLRRRKVKVGLLV